MIRTLAREAIRRSSSVQSDVFYCCFSRSPSLRLHAARVFACDRHNVMRLVRVCVGKAIHMRGEDYEGERRGERDTCVSFLALFSSCLSLARSQAVSLARIRLTVAAFQWFEMRMYNIQYRLCYWRVVRSIDIILWFHSFSSSNFVRVYSSLWLLHCIRSQFRYADLFQCFWVNDKTRLLHITLRVRCISTSGLQMFNFLSFHCATLDTSRVITSIQIIRQPVPLLASMQFHDVKKNSFLSIASLWFNYAFPSEPFRIVVYSQTIHWMLCN